MRSAFQSSSVPSRLELGMQEAPASVLPRAHGTRLCSPAGNLVRGCPSAGAVVSPPGLIVSSFPGPGEAPCPANHPQPVRPSPHSPECISRPGTSSSLSQPRSPEQMRLCLLLGACLGPPQTGLRVLPLTFPQPVWLQGPWRSLAAVCPLLYRDP